MIGLESYQFGDKKKWRRQVWNQIVSRLKVPIGDAVVLYLPGPDDEDGKIAIQKGFKRRNLIAVDLNNNNIIKIRKTGGIGICGEMTAVLENWKSPPYIDVIMGDFCCGLENKLLAKFINALNGTNGFRPNKSDSGHLCVVMVNLMRGRDSSSNELRDIFKEDVTDKHRGRFLLKIYEGTVFHQHLEIRNRVDYLMKKYGDDCIPVFVEHNEHFRGMLESFLYLSTNMMKETNPCFLSYKSISRVFMDTIIFNHCNWFPSLSYQEKTLDKNDYDIRRKIGATKAIRTMKHFGVAA